MQNKTQIRQTSLCDKSYFLKRKIIYIFIDLLELMYHQCMPKMMDSMMNLQLTYGAHVL